VIELLKILLKIKQSQMNLMNISNSCLIIRISLEVALAMHKDNKENKHDLDLFIYKTL
jgi:hypothetical protein